MRIKHIMNAMKQPIQSRIAKKPLFNGGEWRWAGALRRALEQPIVAFAAGLLVGAMSRC
jgi:hypothetical protein